jgi:hypothetical protein
MEARNHFRLELSTPFLIDKMSISFPNPYASDKANIGRTLAHLLRSDLVAEYYIAAKEIREYRSLLRLRTSLVQDRTRVINRTHSLLG